MLRNTIASALMILLASVLLFFSLRGIDWMLVMHTITGVRPARAACSVVLGLIPLVLRAARWRILLQARASVSFKTTFWAIAAGYFGNNFLPARGGELVRSYIVRERSSLGGSYILSTALTERVADAVSLILTGAVLLTFTPQAADWINAVRNSFILIGIAGLLFLVCLPQLEKPASKMLKRWPILLMKLEQALMGIRSLHDGTRLFHFAALTAAIWAIDALATTTLAYALNIQMSIKLAMLLIVALSLSSAIPSTPGYIGVYQFVAVTVLKPFGILPSAAIAFMLVTQAANYLITSILGLLAMTRFTPFNWQFVQRSPQPIHIQS